jgi:hypothetical protein
LNAMFKPQRSLSACNVCPSENAAPASITWA